MTWAGVLLWLVSAWYGSDLANLGSPVWSVRDAAHARMARAGWIGSVAAWTERDNTDPEVRWRCRELAQPLSDWFEVSLMDWAAYCLFMHPDKWCSKTQARPWANRKGMLHLSDVTRRWKLLGAHPNDGDAPWELAAAGVEVGWDATTQVQAFVNVIRHRAKGTPLSFPGDPLGPRN